VHPGKIQLLVGLVEYKTNLKIRRKGLLSSWLKDLPEGYRIPTKLDAPTLFLPKENENVPVVLVGPGTGVAPMRAFVEERIRTGAAKGSSSPPCVNAELTCSYPRHGNILWVPKQAAGLLLRR
jgi:sulfite reductase alpha subunit-like flavoprotein